MLQYERKERVFNLERKRKDGAQVIILPSPVNSNSNSDIFRIEYVMNYIISDKTVA